MAAAKYEPAAAAKKTRVNQWTVDDVRAFFIAQKLDVHIAAIEENGVNGRLLLKAVERQALVDLGITNKFHVIKIEDGLGLELFLAHLLVKFTSVVMKVLFH